MPESEFSDTAGTLAEPVFWQARPAKVVLLIVQLRTTAPVELLRMSTVKNDIPPSRALKNAAAGFEDDLMATVEDGVISQLGLYDRQRPTNWHPASAIMPKPRSALAAAPDCRQQPRR